MRAALTQLLLCALLLVTLPAAAQLDDEELQLVPLPTELRLSGMARVVTNIARPSDCLAAIAVTMMDGEKTLVSAQSFLIEPGIHSINGKAMLDTTHCPITDKRFQLGRAEDLEFNFELGNTYYVGYYHPSTDPLEWKLVVWDIETNP